jgi:hypothetical protein
MTQRNPQNSIKAGHVSGPSGAPASGPSSVQGKPPATAGHCPACRAEVPFKPGFRFSALKCPKCGASMAKK